jgi:hypothetical protein
MNAGPELAKLTTIFADSTSSRQRRLTPNSDILCCDPQRPVYVDSGRIWGVTFAQMAVCLDVGPWTNYQLRNATA